MKYIIQALFLLFSIGYINAQHTDDISVSFIPDSLKKNAYSIVRNHTVEFDHKSEILGIEKHHIIITILNEKGDDEANFRYYGDKFRELKKFSGKLYDAKGTLLRKIKQSDINTTEYSFGLADDGKFYYYKCTSPVYPFTIEYKYEINRKRGTFSFPTFSPQSTYNQSVQQSKYSLTTPQEVKIRSKALNMSKESVVSINKNIATYEWTLDGIPAIPSESLSSSIKKYVPILYLSPENFVYDGVPGTITDWESYGRWVYGLYKDRGELPQEAKNKIIELTQYAQTDREKVEILYNYLRETTRYVSIQLGIGGFQPMRASEVYKTGFGDCKALSFYMKSMLDVIGIPSDYLEIRMDRKNKTLMADYSNFHETNHAILQVPLNQDTLWLECTNPKIPFGYIHSGIVGHDAVETGQEGGRICRLRDYPDSLNIDKNVSMIDLRADGAAHINALKEYHLKYYENLIGYNTLKKSEQIDFLRKKIKLPHADVQEFTINEQKTPLPYIQINYDWNTKSYGTQTGNRLFIPINPYRLEYNWFNKRERTTDIEFSYGFNDIDEFTLLIPDGFEIETIPASEIIESPYGVFKSSIIPTQNEIRIIQSFYLPRGYYPTSSYEEIRSFFDKVNKTYSASIILRKKQENQISSSQ